MIKKIRNKRELDVHWNSCVKRGKALVAESHNIQMAVAELALKACDIVWGGGGHWSLYENQYTITRFAEEIGINKKTLMEWTRVKRQVYDKLSSAAQEKALTSNFQVLAQTVLKVARDAPKKEVTQVYLETKKLAEDPRARAAKGLLGSLRRLNERARNPGLSSVSNRKKIELVKEIDLVLKELQKYAPENAVRLRKKV